MAKYFCINCMSPLDTDTAVCPYCSFDRRQYAAPEMALPPGNTLGHGKYLLGRTLGQGGFGVTYVALDQLLELRVAIKEYLPQNMAYRNQGSVSLHWHSNVLSKQAGWESFVKEARKMAKMDQIPGIVRVREVFYENETAYIVMDYVDGETLLKRLLKTGPMDGKTCLAVLRPVMNALTETHKNNMIHRDISPDNIMLDNRNRVWLLDMGAAKELDTTQAGALHHSTTMVVKPGFSPLEQYTSGGNTGPWTDVYAMSATILYCMSGKMPPFATDRVLHDNLEIPNTIPPAVARVLLHGLALRPEDRFQSMVELRDALETAVNAPNDAEIRRREEEARRREQERQQAEEARRREQERQQAEEARRREQEHQQARTPQKTEKVKNVKTKQKTKKILFIIPVAVVIVGFIALFFLILPHSGKCGDNATWKLYPNGVLTVSGTGDMTDYSYSYSNGSGDSPWWDMRKDIRSVVIQNGITSIGNHAFYHCESLTSVTIPDSVTTIGNYAFCDCNRLTSVTIPDSVTTIGSSAFWDCESLTSVTIPDSVTTIGSSAFWDCKSLTSVTIPDSVTTIGNNTFSSCRSLTSVTIPDSVTTIGDNTFSSCRSLTSVTIPDSVTTIGDSAFAGCDNLTNIMISAENPNYISVDGILFNISQTELCQYPAGKSAQSYVIPDSVTTIGNGAFSGCKSLTSVTIPDSVTTIGSSAFWDCESLTSVTIPDSVTTIGNHAFYECKNLTDVTIPDSVTTIGNYAFAYCDSLTSVTIPDSVTTIGDGAFRGCDSLTSVTIPDSVTTIGSSAFRDCDNLTSVTIPDSVTYISRYAFYDCDSLTSVSVPAGAEIADDAFPDTTTVTRR